MSKLQIALGFSVAAAGFGLGLLLLPSDGELALINLKGAKYREALASYEARLQEKGPSVGVVMPLAQLYLHYGNIEKAVAAMEQFVTDNPKAIDARQRLGLYYDYSYRREDYLLNLQEINRLRPTEARLRELSELYSAAGRHQDRVAVLEILVERHPHDPKDFFDLALLQATVGQLSKANKTLERLEKAYPDAISPKAAELRVSLLIDTEEPDAALSWGTIYASKRQVPEYAERLALIFAGKGAHDEALALLEGFSPDPNQYPQLFATIVEMEIARGRPEAAMARLREAFASQRLDANGRELLIELALGVGDLATAFAVVRSGDPMELPKELIVDLATAALESGNYSEVDNLLANLGPGPLDAPILQARIALVRGDEAAALEWARAAERQPDLALKKQLALADIYRRLGRDREALRLLTAVAHADGTPDWALTELASLYVRLGRADHGYIAFLALREQLNSRAADLGWALLATASGKPEETLQWLNEVGLRRLSSEELETLFFAAIEFTSAHLALLLATERYQREPDALRQRQLAEALVVSGRPDEALAHLRPLVALNGNDAELESIYLSALTAGLKLGAPVRDELRDFLTVRIAAPELDETWRSQLVYALLDIQAYQETLPWLEDRARRDGETWFFTYIEAAKKSGREEDAIAFLHQELGRHDLSAKVQEERLNALLELGGRTTALPHLKRFAWAFGKEWASAYEDALSQLGRRAELVAFLTEYAGRPGMSAEETRAVAFRLLEAGAKEPAERIFQDLAADDAPDSKDVAQYLYLRGPRPGDATVEWLATRTRSARDPAERAAWAQHLINSGEAARAASAIADAPPLPGAEGPLLWVWLEALSADGDRAGMAEVIRYELAVTTEPTRIRRLGRFAREATLTSSASTAYEKLLAAMPNDLEALRYAGRFDFLEGRYSDAGEHLEQYLDLVAGTPDYESLYYLAEIRRRDEQPTARPLYELALRIVESQQVLDAAAQETRAWILHRLHRTGEALTLMESLLKETPGDANLRAAFASILLEAGDYRRARAVLWAS